MAAHALVGDADPHQVTRTMVLWIPDWPAFAAARADGIPLGAPLALIDRGEVHACSAAARSEGVRRGLRVREAQSRCASLLTLPFDPALDARAFEPVLDRIDELMPGVQVLRPGIAALRAQGPARYFGNEGLAAESLLAHLDDAGVAGSRIGIADGPFAAEQAARLGSGRVSIVEPGGSPAFLAPLPVAVLGLPALGMLLRRLGLPNLGMFAELPEAQVGERFGIEGMTAHRLARGLDGRRVIPRIPPDELDVETAFEPPLDRVDQVTFGVRASADRFLDRLAEMRLVCTGLRVEITSESGELSARTWLHPRSFTPAEVVDRVRWQLQGTGAIDSGLRSPVVRVRILPHSVDEAVHHEPGLWGGGPDAALHHGLSRVQSMLGHTAVVTVAVGGGRMLADRQVLVPWGDRELIARPADRPWPGALLGMPPSTVFPDPRPCILLTPSGDPVTVDERGAVNGPPARFAPPGAGRTVGVGSWAGPWPVEERWWDPNAARSLHRFQVVDAQGDAWLVVIEGGACWVEARYD
ncbi:DNA polymerase Y family protein [Amnibacterium flavum]|uniref:DNA polymerase n=1 Tax=Amnibacterium flavum TaxID=2173173 RepID=A0A2V1HW60_9MICO|nr:DNA polymerase Y family protein [Amnibacterium flavum]PVZ94464.1 DNA polymerase [Amnibacterium flavum]